MAQTMETISRAGRFLERNRGLILPVIAAGLVFVIIVPLPPGLMDVLLAANLALSALILLTVIYTSRPADFSVFPSLLLMATLLRLVLNVASTRLILTAGAGGAAAEGSRFAAGRVIWAFSQFVTSGSLAVGVILLAILVIIQFIVVTKGAARISEVAARFTLDALPGKQMAIDSDLNAGLIDREQARRRRGEIAHEADFYGAMDGASKFLRGDAVAAVIITFVNILGGLYIGMIQYRWSWAESVQLFTRLTVGDGLVTQIPAFLLSVSAGLLVTRSTARTHLGEEVLGQLGTRPIVLGITAALLAALMLTSLPKIPLLMLGAGLGGLAWMAARRRRRRADTDRTQSSAPGAAPDAGEPVENLLAVDPMRVDLGYALVALVDPGRQGDLLERIAALRRETARELGLLVPPIRIRDDMRLGSHQYAICIRGTRAADGRLYADQLLAVTNDAVVGKLLGRETAEPVSGAPAVWINPTRRGRAEMMNYTVLAPAAVLIGHLQEVIRARAADLLTRERTARLLDNLRPRAESLVREVTEKLKIGRIQKVLQDLLRERVSIRDLEAILEALSDAADRTDDPELLTQSVRGSLAAALTQQYRAADGRLWCVTLDPEFEETLTDQVGLGTDGSGPGVTPETARRISDALTEGLSALDRQGKAPVVLCAPRVRSTVRRWIVSAGSRAAVLAYNEVDSATVEPVASVGMKS